ncbi:hypothetical protein MUK42_23642 [Musa troglodytarum]|uniref:F-box domain-containing protein n=1 Tax=Musa troglodytarum TaxID=320322 RepID=A0A9E7KAU8_9LILI|nr:hypothetical protein MUK42_23642 [Musa troglodytarum]
MEKKKNMTKHVIKYISIDIIESVLRHLNPKDIVRFRTIYKEWWAIAPRYGSTLSKIL